MISCVSDPRWWDKPGPKKKRKIRQTYLLFLVEKIKHVLHINESLLDHPGNKTSTSNQWQM